MSDKCPLTGKPCDNPKTIACVKFINGKSTKYDLCTSCAAMPNIMAALSTEEMDPIQAKVWDSFLTNMFHNLHIDQIFEPAKLKQLKSSIKDMNDLNNFLTTLLHKSDYDPNLGKCPKCEATLEEMMATGQAGCPTCYEAFKPFFMPLVQRIHNANKHVGKKPKTIALSENIEKLQEQMQEAVAAEKYEEAARIRDKIKEIKALNPNCEEDNGKTDI